MPTNDNIQTIKTVPWVSELSSVALPEDISFSYMPDLKSLDGIVYLYDCSKVVRLNGDTAESVFNTPFISFDDLFLTKNGVVGVTLQRKNELVVTPLTQYMQDDPFNRPFKIPGKFVGSKRRKNQLSSIGFDGSSIYVIEGDNVNSGKLRVVNPENGSNETLNFPRSVNSLNEIYSNNDHIWVTADIKRKSRLKREVRAFKVKAGKIIKSRVLHEYLRYFDNGVFYTEGDKEIYAEGPNNRLWEWGKPFNQGQIIAASEGYVHFLGYDGDSHQLVLLKDGKELSRMPFNLDFLFSQGPTAYVSFERGTNIGLVENGRGHGFVPFRGYQRLSVDETNYAIGGNDLYIANRGKCHAEVFHAVVGRKQLVE
jgi:hypothetical protein